MIRVPDAWYVDATPDGSFVALIPNRHLVTQRGNVPLPHGQNLLYVRIAPDGVRFAGAGHQDDLVWEWDGTSWTSHGAAYGVSPVIYDHDGTLLKNDGSWGSQGPRYIGPDGDVITADTTYYSVTLGLSEFSWLGAPDLYVGQSHDDNQDSAWIWDAGTHRLLEPGPCRFIRSHRDGERVSIAIWKPGQGAVIHWLTLAEMHALPVVGTITPNPGTPPAPPPEPPLMNAPNRIDVVRAVLEAHPEIDARDEDSLDGGRAVIVDWTAQRLNTAEGRTVWGRKSRGRPNGDRAVNPNTDGLTYLRGDGQFEIYDVISGIDGSATWEGYGPFTPGENGWWAPPQLGPEPTGRQPDAPPVDNPPPAPPVTPIDVTAILARLDLMEKRSEIAQADTRAHLKQIAESLDMLLKRQPPPAPTVAFPDYQGRAGFLGTITLKPVR